jgi:hypothetical protein
MNKRGQALYSKRTGAWQNPYDASNSASMSHNQMSGSFGFGNKSFHYGFKNETGQKVIN